MITRTIKNTDLRGNLVWEKPQMAMSTNNPLLGSEYNVITITMTYSIKQPDIFLTDLGFRDNY